MENDRMNLEYIRIERSLKSKQLRLAIHGLGMVLLSFSGYFMGFFMYLNYDLKYWLSLTFLSFDLQEWILMISMNVFLLPRLLLLYRSYEAKQYGDRKKAVQYRILWALVLLCSIVLFFASVFFMFEATAKKPVIYLYPEAQTEVNVRLELNGRVTDSYPEYNNAYGWTVTAEPDGQLTDEDGNQYPYLFWEGNIAIRPDLSKGFCVKGENTEAFLTDALFELGLTDTEAADFIEYWCSLMEQNKYNVITFQTAAYEDVSGLIISPEPDTVIRVNMLWYPVNKPVEIESQDLSAINPAIREGFTVVEWGGEEYKRR